MSAGICVTRPSPTESLVKTSAGYIIGGFAHLVMGGDFVIGIIVFLILVTINFLVITKGATRIAEVGQAVQSNTTLASLLTATSLSQAEQLIGRTVTSADGSRSGEVASVSVGSAGAVATLTNGGTVSLANGASVR